MKNPKQFGPVTVADDGWWIEGHKVGKAEAACYDAACFCRTSTQLSDLFRGVTSWDEDIAIIEYVRRIYEWTP